MGARPEQTSASPSRITARSDLIIKARTLQMDRQLFLLARICMRYAMAMTQLNSFTPRFHFQSVTLYVRIDRTERISKLGQLWPRIRCIKLCLKLPTDRRQFSSKTIWRTIIVRTTEVVEKKGCYFRVKVGATGFLCALVVTKQAGGTRAHTHAHQ